MYLLKVYVICITVVPSYLPRSRFSLDHPESEIQRPTVATMTLVAKGCRRGKVTMAPQRPSYLCRNVGSTGRHGVIASFELFGFTEAQCKGAIPSGLSVILHEFLVWLCVTWICQFFSNQLAHISWLREVNQVWMILGSCAGFTGEWPIHRSFYMAPRSRAVTAFPDEYQSLQQIFQKRASANKEVERVRLFACNTVRVWWFVVWFFVVGRARNLRQKWLQEQVIPALNTCSLVVSWCLVGLRGRNESNEMTWWGVFLIITWEDLNLGSRVQSQQKDSVWLTLGLWTVRHNWIPFSAFRSQQWTNELCVAFSNQGRIFQGFPEPIIRKIAEHLLQATYTCGLDAHWDLCLEHVVLW